MLKEFFLKMNQTKFLRQPEKNMSGKESSVAKV